MSGPGKALMCLFTNLIGFDSLLLLGLKTLTPLFTVAYYLIMEEYNPEDLTVDGLVFYFFIFWHFYSRLLRTCFEVFRKEYMTVIPFVVLALLVFIG